MNRAKLTAICHNMGKESELLFNSVMLYYFLENILKKLAQNKYYEKFTFRGGFLLSNVVGIDSRSTINIDLLLGNMHLSGENVLKTVQELLEAGHSGDISCKINGINIIKGNDQHEGFRTSILCRMENIRQIVPFDITTSDVVTPHSTDYKYISAFGQEDILIKACPIETIVAEKTQTMYSRGFLDNRSRDYYGLYIIYKLEDKEIDTRTLKEACIRIFGYRKTELDIGKIMSSMRMLETDQVFLERWNPCSKKNLYARDIKLEDIINNGINIMEKIKNQ